MQYDEIIAAFVTNLEKELGVVLKKEENSLLLTLSAIEPLFSLHIYYPNTPVIRLEDQTYKTFHIDIDQVLSDSKKIISRLVVLLGKGRSVYARKTVVARIDKKVALEFQTDHHLQSALAGKYRYGLFFNGELVSIAIFSGGRHMRDKSAKYRSFELLRFCHKSGLRVVGGLSKLIQAFIKDFSPNDIMTYVDRDWTHLSNLHTIGFSERGQTSPQRFWAVKGNRYHITDEMALAELKRTFPNGYLIHNSGSNKLVLQLP